MAKQADVQRKWSAERRLAARRRGLRYHGGPYIVDDVYVCILASWIRRPAAELFDTFFHTDDLPPGFALRPLAGFAADGERIDVPQQGWSRSKSLS